MRRSPAATTVSGTPPRRLRSLVLAGAVAAGLAVWLAVRDQGALAQAPAPSAPPEAAARSAATTEAQANDAAKPASERPGVSARIDIRKDESGKRVITIEKGTSAADAGTGRKIVTIEGSVTTADNEDAATDAAADGAPAKGKQDASRRRKGVQIDIEGDGQEFDSFDQLVHDRPAIAGMVVGIVAIIFLSPVLLIAVVLWYRFRKTRMLNETMLKLAEKGVVPPGEAIEALASGKAAAPLTANAAASPIYEQAKALRRRTAWSDLRKGVIMGGVGLGLTLYSIINHGSANPIGLVLLFVGIGYAALWWFEDRQPGLRGTSASAAEPRPPAPPSA